MSNEQISDRVRFFRALSSIDNLWKQLRDRREFRGYRISEDLKVILDYTQSFDQAELDAANEISDAEIEAFRLHQIERHNYCDELEDCCIRGGLNAARKARAR